MTRAAIIVADAFWGDSGKGKIAAYLARKHRAAYAALGDLGLVRPPDDAAE